MNFSFNPLSFDTLSGMGRDKLGASIFTFTQGENTQQEILEFKNTLQEQGFTVNNDNEIFANGTLWGFIRVKTAEESKPIKKPKIKRADYDISPKDKLTKAIFGCIDKFSPQEFFDPVMTPVSTGKKISVSAMLRYENLPEYLQDKLPTAKTRAVHDIMTGLIIKGNAIISLTDIAYALGGYSSERQPSESLLKEIEAEADWLIHTWAKIDATGEAKARGYDIKEVTFDRPLIPGGSVEVIAANGKHVKAYEIWQIPVLYAYAMQKKQVITVSIDCLTLPEKVNLTFDNIILRNYLMEQIESMSLGQIGCVILYETLYKVLGAQETSRQNKQKIREHVKAFLDNWKALSYIEDWKEESEGRLLTRVIITPFKRKKLK